MAESPSELLPLLECAKDSRHCLLVWKLVFDHFLKASLKLRETNAADIKVTGHVTDLLGVVVEVLHIVDRPINASKFRIEDCEMGNPCEYVMLPISLGNRTLHQGLG